MNKLYKVINDRIYDNQIDELKKTDSTMDMLWIIGIIFNVIFLGIIRVMLI